MYFNRVQIQMILRLTYFNWTNSINFLFERQIIYFCLGHKFLCSGYKMYEEKWKRLETYLKTLLLFSLDFKSLCDVTNYIQESFYFIALRAVNFKMGKIFTRRGMRLFSIGLTKNLFKFYMSIPFAYGLSHNKHSYEIF